MAALDDIKAHLNITEDFDNALLTDKIAVAEEFISNYIAADDPITYADAAPTIKEAIRKYVAHLYENRETVLIGVHAQELPMGFYELLDHHRDWTF